MAWSHGNPVSSWSHGHDFVNGGHVDPRDGWKHIPLFWQKTRFRRFLRSRYNRMIVRHRKEWNR